MEGLTAHGNYLKNLLRQARRLTSSAFSLSAIFEEEANQLNRKDEASRLKALYFSIRRQLDWTKSSEDAARYGHSQADLITSLGGLAVGTIIKMASNNKQLSAFSDYLLTRSVGKQPPSGMVLVCIGPKGLPNDVGVVSVSRLARESNQEESGVINELRERGYLLFNENTFSFLIDKLIKDIQKGRLLLPISTQKLAEIKTSTVIKFEAKKSG